MTLSSLRVICFLTSSFSFGVSDYDTSIIKRRENGRFYGFIPNTNEKRTTIFLSMIIISSCHIFSRTMSVAFVCVLDSTLLGYFFSADLGVFLLYKLARRDFFHWFPFPGKRALVMTTVIRVAIKLVTDMTCLFHFRKSNHPNPHTTLVPLTHGRATHPPHPLPPFLARFARPHRTCVRPRRSLLEL